MLAYLAKLGLSYLLAHPDKAVAVLKDIESLVVLIKAHQAGQK